MCFGCSKEPSHRDGSFEYPQHMFWMRNEENNFPIRTLIWRPGDVAQYPLYHMTCAPENFEVVVCNGLEDAFT